MIQLLGIAVLAGLGPLGLQGGLNVETGIEYDSNANRAESDGPNMMDPQGSPLLRLLGAGVLQYRRDAHVVNLQLTAAGKIFFLPAVQDQDVGVLQVNYEHGAQLRRLRLTGLLDYYDAYQAPAPPERSRDFRAGSTGLRIFASRPLKGPHSVEGGADFVAQLFMYKPDPCYNFVAPSVLPRVGFRFHTGDPELGHDFELGLSGRFDYRGFTCGRTDGFFQGGVSATWVGPVLVQVGYVLQVNLSATPPDVQEENYHRHLVQAKLGARLPGDLYLTIKGQLNLLKAAPWVTLVPLASIDEDNRSLAMVDVERPLPRGLAVSARYTGYFNLGAPSYQRHTIYLGLSYRFRTGRKR